MIKLLGLGLTPDRAISYVQTCWPRLRIGFLVCLYRLAEEENGRAVFAVLALDALSDLKDGGGPIEMGFVARNVAAGVTLKRGSREKAKVVPPSKADIRALIAQARQSANRKPMWLPMLLTFVFAGLRASELRGLAWRNVDLKRKMITIDQRADRENVIGAPKSAAGRRSIPIPDMLVTELQVWKLRCGKSDLDLVFPSTSGTPIFHANIVLGFQDPLQIAAGITRPKISRGKAVLDEDGGAVVEGRYTLHCFRHAAASLWIERKVAPKRVQTWMGHSSIQVTFDTYGHLFAAMEDDAAIMAAVEAELLPEAKAEAA